MTHDTLNDCNTRKIEENSCEFEEVPADVPAESDSGALDGGWAWIVLAASFFCSVIVDGMCFSFGIFYLEFLDYYRENRSLTAWVGSVLNGMYMIMAPVAGALVIKFGCRSVTLLGSLWAATSFFVSTFSPNIVWLIITYGVLGGMGFGFMYLPSLVIVGHYFDKKRAFATGIATAGSGIGTFIFAPLTKYLIHVYAWKGATWIISAIVLHGVVAAALFRPLSQNKKKIKLIKSSSTHTTPGNIDNTKNKTIPEVQASVTQSLLKLDSSSKVESPVFYSQVNLQSKSPKEKHSFVNSKINLSSSRNYVGASIHGIDTLGTSLSYSQKYLEKISTSASPTEDSKVLFEEVNISNTKTVSQTQKTTKPLPAKKPKTTNSQQSRISGQHSQTSIAHRTTKRTVAFFKEFLANIKMTTDLSLLSHPTILLYSCSCILCMAGFFVPFVYLVDYAIEIGIDSKLGALLLSILGIANTGSRVLAGWVSDRPWADCLLVNNIALICGGVATALCPFLKQYYLLIIYTAIFGICIAAFVTLRPIILVDLIGIDRLTSAFGIIVLCQGITSFLGAPFAGLLYDITGSFNVSFYVAGISIGLAGIICLPLRTINTLYIKKYENRKTVNC